MKRLTPYSWLILIIFSSCLTGNKVASTDKQIESLLSQMTLEEKIGMLHSNTMFSSTRCSKAWHPRPALLRRTSRSKI